MSTGITAIRRRIIYSDMIYEIKGISSKNHTKNHTCMTIGEGLSGKFDHNCMIFPKGMCVFFTRKNMP